MSSNQMLFAGNSSAKSEPWTTKELLLFLGVLLLAMALRLYFVLGLNQPEMTGDEKYYDELARQLLDTGVYGYRSHTPNAYVTPGYPVFLAIVYKFSRFFFGYYTNIVENARTFQAVLLIISIALMYLIARKIGGKKVALFSALIGALYPSMIWSAGSVLTEVLFTTVFLAYFFTIMVALEKHSIWFCGLSGIFFGVCVLTRPQVAPFFFIPFLMVYFKHRSKDALVMFVIFSTAFALVMMPWWVRNYMTFHRVILSATQTGNPLLAGTDPYNRLGVEKLFKGVKPEEQTKYALERIKNGFKHEPLLYLKWFTVGKFTIMFKDPWVRFPGGFLRPLANMHLPIVILGWAGLLLATVKPRLRLMATTVLYVTFIQLLFLPLPRYVFPLIPFLIISAVYLPAQISTKLSRQPKCPFMKR